MNKPLIVLVLLAAVGGVALAAPVDCQFRRPSLQQLISDPLYADGCYVQDKLFSNFGYVQGGGANPTAAQVRTTFGLTLGPNPPAGDLHEVRFTSIGLSWTLPFTITYNVGLYLPPPNTVIVEGFLDVNVPGADTLPTGSSTMVGANSTYIANATVPAPGLVAINNETALSIRLDINTRGQRVTQIVGALTQDVNDTVVPEPTTFGLLGGGLVLIGLVRRRR